ncbi:MAG: hypothetical protein Q7K45_06970, partial [Nanoarchaeota archaeon]|nr:hypothetical protein [Nanoarchaeota archaeon]
MMVHHIIAHSVDPDGIITHAILERSLKPSGHKINHHYVDYPQLGSALEKMLTEEPGRVIVADLSLNDEIAREDLFRSLVERHRHISWYDHHASSLNGREFLGRFCSRVALASNKCAAKLVALDYAPQNEYVGFLAELAQVHDFENSKSRLMVRAQQLQDIIASGYDLPTLVKDLSDEKAWHGREFKPKYHQVIADFNQLKVQAYHFLEQSIGLVNIAGFNIAFSLAPACLYMKLAPRYLEEKRNTVYPETDCFVVVYEGMNNVILKGYGQLGPLVPSLCISQQGGGRSHAGGFLLNHPVSADTYQRDKKEIIQKITTF